MTLRGLFQHGWFCERLGMVQVGTAEHEDPLSSKTGFLQHSQIYLMKTTAMELSGYVWKVNHNNNISGGYTCISTASTVGEPPGHLSREWTLLGTSIGWLFSHFGFPIVGMSSGSGSPEAEQDILLLSVSLGPMTLPITWRIFEAEPCWKDVFLLLIIITTKTTSAL